jgi:catechol 2,3-dioxygenase-like lactoylglutathione lyase family enzyme
VIPRPDPGGAPAIVGVLETSLYAQDLARTAAFYSDLLGLKPLLASARLVAFEVAARSVLLIFQAGATEEDVVDARGVIPGHDGHGRLHLALSIAEDDLEAWRARLAKRGVAVAGEYRWPRGGVSLYFHDPDGALVELASPGLWWPRPAPDETSAR